MIEFTKWKPDTKIVFIGGGDVFQAHHWVKNKMSYTVYQQFQTGLCVIGYNSLRVRELLVHYIELENSYLRIEKSHKGPLYLSFDKLRPRINCNNTILIDTPLKVSCTSLDTTFINDANDVDLAKETLYKYLDVSIKP